MSEYAAPAEAGFELSEDVIAAVAVAFLAGDEPDDPLPARPAELPYSRFRDPRGWR
ncbi:hypothetical protein [Nocardia sp. NPDC051833]|uniref:hypothetical protein n=1 Tax=Nocardia sp. NPDC051833 TaxID=3155674 RepID=UPI00342BF117